MFRFLSNVKIEMKKVSWPTGKQLMKYTAVVIATVTFMAAFFYLVDMGISSLIRLIK